MTNHHHDEAEEDIEVEVELSEPTINFETLEISDEEFSNIPDITPPSPPSIPVSSFRPSDYCPISGILGGLGLRLRSEWLDSCVRGLEGLLFTRLDDAAEAKLCFEQFLCSDMNCVGAGVLPENVHDMHLVDLAGPFVLQLELLLPHGRLILLVFPDTIIVPCNSHDFCSSRCSRDAGFFQARKLKHDGMVFRGYRSCSNVVHSSDNDFPLAPNTVGTASGVSTSDRTAEDFAVPMSRVSAEANQSSAGPNPPSAAPVHRESAERNPSSAAPIHREVAEPSPSYAASFDREMDEHIQHNASSSSAVLEVDDIHMAEAVEHLSALTGDLGTPFTYLAIADMLGFQYKRRTMFELHVYVHDGSLISEILIDHEVVQKAIGHSPKDVTAALASSDMNKVRNMKETMKQFHPGTRREVIKDRFEAEPADLPPKYLETLQQ
ncbi:hypothetical protein RJ640_022221, partial [Escallonia rubra]